MDDVRRFVIDERLFPALRMNLPPCMPEPGDAGQAAAALKAARETMRRSVANAAVEADAHARRWGNELLGCRARAALAADIPLVKEEIELGFHRGVDADLLCRQLADLDERPMAPLDGFRDAAAARVVNALRLLQVEGIEKKIPSARKDRRQAERMLETVYTLNEARPSCRRIMRELAAADRLFTRLCSDGKNQKAIQQVVRLTKRLHTTMIELRGSLSTLEYPFPHSAQGLTMGTYMVEHLPSDDEVGNVLTQAQMTMERFWPTYYRALGPLLTAALRVEDALGLEPIPSINSPPAAAGGVNTHSAGG